MSTILMYDYQTLHQNDSALTMGRGADRFDIPKATLTVSPPE